MANQAFSLSEDLMVGAGILRFKRSDDTFGWHDLGNAEDFNITVDTTKVEKNSSRNKARTLMSSTITAVKPSAKVKLFEYNPYNLALGLYGTEGVEQQAAKTVVDEEYTVAGTPGIITLADADGNRYFNVTDIVVKPQTTVPAMASFVSVSSALGTLSTVTNANDTYTDVKGGKIKIEAGTFAGTVDERIFFNVKTAPTAAGSVAGLVLDVKEGVVGVTQEFTATTGASETFTTTGGIKFTVTLGVSDNLTVFPAGTTGEAKVTPSLTAYVKDRDYTYTEQELRAGIILIKEGSAITKGAIIKISYKVPEQQFVCANLGNAGNIEGELLYVGDCSNGPNYVIEGWKVKISPDGSLDGLIGTDYSSFGLTIDFLDDSEHHSDYPFAKCTCVGKATSGGANGSTYDPKY